MTDNMWDRRFSEPGFAYGTTANEFLQATAVEIPPGRVLSLAEGEGRNAVHLADLGYDVTAVDSSSIGLAKARRLAEERGVTINTVLADLAEFGIRHNAWSGIISIYCHLPPTVRRDLHARCIAGLAPGGVFLLEGFTLRQLELGTGGPKDPKLLFDRRTLEEELEGLDLVLSREIEKPTEAGRYHRGTAAILQIVAVKTAA
jgi:SAM-dependent methyltransferase